MQNFQLYKAAAIIVLLFSCSPAVDKIPDLDKVGSDFNAGKFFKDKIEQTNKTIATPPTSMTRAEALKKLDENFFAKDTLCYYTTDAFDGQHIHSKSDYGHRNKKHEGIYGYTYSTISWSKKDSLAVLKGIYFQTLNMFETKDGKLVSVKATNESYSNANYTKLVNHLNKKYGTAKQLSKNNEAPILEWETNDAKIQLKTTKKTVEDILSIAVDGKKEVKQEKEYTIEYYRVTKKYLKDLQIVKIGRWYLESED